MTKVFETVIEEIFPEMVDIDAMQFGFMPGKGTMDDIFIARQLQKSILKIRRNFFLPLWTWKIPYRACKVGFKTLKKLGLNEWLTRAVMVIYIGIAIVIRINSTVADKFDLIVRVHQGFVLSPLLFIIVLEALLREC